MPSLSNQHSPEDIWKLIPGFSVQEQAQQRQCLTSHQHEQKGRNHPAGGVDRAAEGWLLPSCCHLLPPRSPQRCQTAPARYPKMKVCSATNRQAQQHQGFWTGVYASLNQCKLQLKKDNVARLKWKITPPNVKLKGCKSPVLKSAPHVSCCQELTGAVNSLAVRTLLCN